MQMTPDHQRQIDKLIQLFLKENARVNLSAFRTAKQCYIGNVLDSLAFLDVVPQLTVQPKKILDLGTGGGFPLLPLAMMMPETQFVGLDAVQKKIDAVERIAKELEQTNTTFVCRRAEEYAHREGDRASFDIVTCRAVAPIATLLEYAVPLLRERGCLVCWKSLHIAEELRQSAHALSLLQANLVLSHEYALPEDWGKRQLLIFRKNAPTPSEYPRRVGVPRNKPLA